LQAKAVELPMQAEMHTSLLLKKRVKLVEKEVKAVAETARLVKQVEKTVSRLPCQTDLRPAILLAGFFMWQIE
jgi:hypothetical protein